MTLRIYKRGFYLLVLLSLALIAVIAKLTYDHAWLCIETSFAEEQTEIFDEMRAKALQSNPGKAVEYLEYAVNYYPSGTKQVKGSRLDRIVERARQNAIHDILAYLRVKTGKDLGNDPQRWIDEYQQNPK